MPAFIHIYVLRTCALVCLIGLSSCALVQLRGETEEFYAATVLAGQVISSDWHGPIIVAAVEGNGGRYRVVHQIWLHEPGGYELIVPDGTFTIVAFGDEDGDEEFDPDEPAATLASEMVVSGEGLILLVNLTLSRDDTADRSLFSTVRGMHGPSRQVGSIADLNDAAFSIEAGAELYWKPLTSFRRHGGNVYFLEPYNPNRIPVLFVHGASGSAQDWRYFFENLDRTRYQAWLFQYPSGAPLDSMAHLLYWKMLNLQARHPFSRLHIVAHSMGGLVARRFLSNHGHEFPQIDQFISISTPWDGERLASVGVEHSPAIVPSWRDMQPQGAFLLSLFDKPLPHNVKHALLFGHRGGYSLLSPNTDGVVTLASQLRPIAQSQAHFLMGFDQDHVSILNAPDVVSQVHRILDESRQHTESGFVDVRWSLDEDGEQSVRTSFVMFTSVNDGSRIVLPMPTRHSDLKLGPLPPGEYDASPLIQGFRSEPRVQRIRIASGNNAKLAFDLKPQGTLLGFVETETNSIEQPAGSWRKPPNQLSIERIVLRGANIERTLEPRIDGDTDLTEAYIRGKDDAVASAFSFVELPDGEYTLTITATGYAPAISHHRVTAGVVPPFSPIRLERKK